MNWSVRIPVAIRGLQRTFRAMGARMASGGRGPRHGDARAELRGNVVGRRGLEPRTLGLKEGSLLSCCVPGRGGRCQIVHCRKGFPPAVETRRSRLGLREPQKLGHLLGQKLGRPREATASRRGEPIVRPGASAGSPPPQRRSPSHVRGPRAIPGRRSVVVRTRCGCESGAFGRRREHVGRLRP